MALRSPLCSAQKAQENLHIWGTLLITWRDISNSAKIHLALMKLSGADATLPGTQALMQQSVCGMDPTGAEEQDPGTTTSCLPPATPVSPKYQPVIA